MKQNRQTLYKYLKRYFLEKGYHKEEAINQTKNLMIKKSKRTKGTGTTVPNNN